ncbi:MAG: hypothetical protein ACRDAM_20850, partial [Casimicrobium sp.]
WSPTADNSGTYTISLSPCGSYRAAAACNLDVDNDGFFDRNDATIIVRRMLGFTGTNIAANMTYRSCAQRQDGIEIADFIDSQIALNATTNARAYDIDDDKVVSATTDGLLLLRVALGVPDASLVAGATGADAQRTSATQIRDYLQNSCGNR